MDMKDKHSKRIVFLDNLKGFAIILVVIGHAVQYFYSPEDFDRNLLFRLVYSFHMPLFFVISGYVTLYSRHSSLTFIWLKKNVLQLLLPFFSWAVLSWIVFHKYSVIDVIMQPDTGLWFLWTLFFVRICFVFSQTLALKLNVTPIIIHVVMYLILFILAYLMKGLFASGMIGRYYFFYTIGYYTAVHKDQLFKVKNIGLSLLTYTSCFLLFSIYWYRTRDAIPELYDGIFQGFIVNDVYKYMTALLGSQTCLLSFFYYRGVNLSFIGKKTLGIYAVHQFLINIMVLCKGPLSEVLYHTPLGIITCILLLLVLSLWLIKVINKSKLGNLLLLGKY